jgi:hypothetical protein
VATKERVQCRGPQLGRGFVRLVGALGLLLILVSCGSTESRTTQRSTEPAVVSSTTVAYAADDFIPNGAKESLALGQADGIDWEAKGYTALSSALCVEISFPGRQTGNRVQCGKDLFSFGIMSLLRFNFSDGRTAIVGMADEKIIRIRVVRPGTDEAEDVATGSVATYQGHRFRTVVAFVARMRRRSLPKMPTNSSKLGRRLAPSH